VFIHGHSFSDGHAMPDLTFVVEDAAPVPFAAEPLMGFGVRVTNTSGEIILTIALRCQIQIEAVRRKYTSEDQHRLLDLFGEPQRWGQTLRTMLWTHATVIVPSFTGSTTAQLQVPCSFDFTVAAVKYFAGLEDGEIPLCFQFSGTSFYANPAGNLQVAPISWDKEARFRLPVRIWKDLMDLYYPNSAWLCLRRDVFQRLHEHKMTRGIPTWEQMLEELMLIAEVEVRR
jgi:hypothetical protein